MLIEIKSIDNDLYLRIANIYNIATRYSIASGSVPVLQEAGLITENHDGLQEKGVVRLALPRKLLS